MKLSVFIICSFLCISLVGNSYSQTIIAAWQTERGMSGAHPATTNNENIEPSSLSRGPALTFIDNSTFTYTSLWPAGQDKTAAKTTGAYYQVVIQAKSGHYVSLSTLDARVRRNNAGAVNAYRWAYSIDGGSFVDIGPADVIMTRTATDDTNGDVQAAIDLSGVSDLQYVPSSTIIILRMYAWGATSAASNFGIGKSTFSGSNVNTLSVGGSTVNTLPPPLVRFISNGGTSIDDLHPESNTTITAPADPVRTGYTFAGWYKEAGFRNVWNFATDVVKTETNLYAKWNPILYNVTFNTDGGTVVAPVQAYFDDKITAPAIPTKAGDYMFGGWYKEAGLLNRWNFATDIMSGDITLYAKWNGPDQVISFGPLEDKVYGDEPFVLNAVVNSDLPASYEALTSNVSISGNVLTIISPGAVTIRATQAGDSFYNPATPVEVSFTIHKAPQTITFAPVGPYSRYYIGTVALTATSSSGLPVSFLASEPTIAELSGTTLLIKGLGRIAVTAVQEGNDYYLAAEPVTNTVVVHTGGALQLLVNKGLSPNGDGINDVFLIEGIKSFEENQVRIMNSNGAEVFSKKGYNNETVVFDGRTDKGDKLSGGTYYYLIEVRQGQTWSQKKGYLVLRY